jgi:hypothetical protein
MGTAMNDEPTSEVLSGLPRRRPHRRSEKRDAPQPRGAVVPAGRPDLAQTPRAPSGPASERLRQPAQPEGIPASPPGAEPAHAGSFSSAGGAELLSTAVQAAAELTEIALSAGARALRNSISRLPRP